MSDLELKREVESALNWDAQGMFPAAIAVVQDGIVTLRGRTESYSAKLSAERAALRVRGVKAVVNEIEVHLPTSTQRTDEDIARAAVNALAWATEVPVGEVKVKVENGIITLIGGVNWYYQKQSAENIVRGLTGIRGVINLIEVRPKVDAIVVKSKIEEALKRNAELDARQITVETLGSKVILRGTVRSWAERAEAERVAWDAPGVTAVENQIAVAVAA